MKKAYEIQYESYGLNGEQPEGEGIVVIVIAGSIEKAISKFRKSLPKSLTYDIVNVEVDPAEVIM